jgi:hypothetical protein
VNIKGECLGVINCAKPQRNCETCKNGYRLVNSKCIYAGNDCEVVQSNGLCSQCKNGFILSGFECINRGTSSISNKNVNLVEKCSLYSRNENNCLECESGFVFVINRCVSNEEYYKVALNNADDRILQKSPVIYINTPSEFIKYSEITYSLNRKDDLIDGEEKVHTKIIFQGVGTSPSGNSNSGSNTGHQNGGEFNIGNNNNDRTSGNNGENDGGSTNGRSSAININEGCLIKAKDTLGCSVCIDGYYFFNGLCKRKTPVCTRFNPKTNKCEACHETFALVNGDCEDLSC